MFNVIIIQTDDENDNPNKINSTAVRISNLYEGSVRIVLHKNITEEEVDMAIEKIKYVVEQISSSS